MMIMEVTFNFLITLTLFFFFSFQEDIAKEAETGKIYRANYHDKLGRTVLVMRPGFQVHIISIIVWENY